MWIKNYEKISKEKKVKMNFCWNLFSNLFLYCTFILRIFSCVIQTTSIWNITIQWTSHDDWKKKMWAFCHWIDCVKFVLCHPQDFFFFFTFWFLIISLNMKPFSEAETGLLVIQIQIQVVCSSHNKYMGGWVA